MNIIQQLEAEQAAKIEAKRTLPEFSPGDTVRVQIRDKALGARVVKPPFVRNGQPLV